MHRGLLDMLRTWKFDAARDLPAIVLAGATILIGLAGESGRELLRYERLPVIEGGQWWRLVSGHFVHLGWPHLWLNLAGCLLVWFLFRRDFRLPQWLLVVASSLLFIDAGFLLLNPALYWYVGLSGLLHGLFAAGMLRWLREGNWEAWVMLVVFAAKLAWEQLAGPLPFTSESAGGPVVVDAHFYGAIGGALAALGLAAIEKRGARV